MKLNTKNKIKDSIKVQIKRKIVKEYIRKNPNCTCRDIKKDIKIKIERIYSSLKDAYEEANVRLSKNLTKRSLKKQKRDAISFIKTNPGCSIVDIHKKTRVNIIRVFGGIINAYKGAGIEYPKKEVTSGVMNPYVIKRCNEFEKRVIQLLSKSGSIQSKVRMPVGIADCLFNYKGISFVVEIKDFRGKNNITMVELKQLMKYMKSLGCQRGIIVCPKESFPKRKNSRNVYKDNLTIQILSEEDLRGRSINLLDYPRRVQPG